MRDVPLPGIAGVASPQHTGVPAGLLFPILAAFASGMVLSLQSFTNGRLAGSLGSVPLAGSINHLTGVSVVVALGLLTGAPRRARRHAAGVPRPRWWHLVAGANGGFFACVTAYAAPRIGIALLTVALVCGQSTGSLMVDRLGLAPAGVRAFTLPRVMGVLIAVSAVGLGAIGSSGALHPELLALAVAAGVGVAVQHAALGHTAQATGEPLVAVAINLSAGLVTLIALVLITTGGAVPEPWSAPPVQWLGGVMGAGIGVVVSLLIRPLGALRLMLLTVAGQAVGGLLLDIVAAPPGKAITPLTVVSAALTIAAVVVSGRSMRSARVDPSPTIP